MVVVHDAREIRAMAQANGVDVIGGNCLGVADSWNGLRIGGALDGDLFGDDDDLRQAVMTRISAATPSRTPERGR